MQMRVILISRGGSEMSFANRATLTAAMAMLAVGATRAESGDKSHYTLWNPTPDSKLREMSADRPDKTESPYTVDAGRFQIETDLLAYTYDRRHGLAARTFDIMPFNLKIGLTSSTDLQLAYDAYSHTRMSGATRDRTSGFGDLTVRLKHNIWGNDGGSTAFAIMPFVKIPTNNIEGLNNDAEGGLIVPLAIDLGHGMELGLMSEVDILRAENGSGYKPAFVYSAALGFDLTDKWGLYVEAFVERSVESGAETIATLSAGVTYAVDANLQLDAGANIGVTDAADDVNLFVGLSRRY